MSVLLSPSKSLISSRWVTYFALRKWVSMCRYIFVTSGNDGEMWTEQNRDEYTNGQKYVNFQSLCEIGGYYFKSSVFFIWSFLILSLSWALCSGKENAM